MGAVATNIINEILEIDQTLFTKDEIISLIKSVTSSDKIPNIESNGILLNPEKFHVEYNGINHVLPKKEFELLYYLIENKNKVVRRDSILTNVWGSDVWVGDRTIDVHIRKLRSRFDTKNLQTIKGIGYTWQE